MKLVSIWTSESGGDVVLKIYLLELCHSSCAIEWNHLCNSERGHHVEHSCEVI